jgi:hypothetical protein
MSIDKTKRDKTDTYTITLLRVTQKERELFNEAGDEHIMGIYAKNALLEKIERDKRN